MRTIETGKYKGKILTNCPDTYIRWAAAHEKNLLESNRWVARDAKIILAKDEEKKMLKGVRIDVSGEFDLLRSIRATVENADGPFSEEEMHNALVSVNNGDEIHNLNRLRKYLVTLCTHLGDFDLLELPDGRYARYSNELYHQLQAK
jgi:hypothetical protein